MLVCRRLRELKDVDGIVRNFSDRLKGAWRQLLGDEFGGRFDPVEANGLRAVCHIEWPVEAELIEAWEVLLGATPAGTTFHSPVWQKAVVELLAKPGRLRLIVVWRGSELIAVLPMSVRDDGLLESLAPGVSDYLDPLIHPEHEADAWRVILKLMTKLRAGKWKGVTLHNVRDGAACRGILPELAAAEGFSFESTVYESCPALTLPKTWEEFLVTLDSHERKETRRKVNKVMTKGAGRVVRCGSDPAEIAAALPVAMGLLEQAPGEKGLAIKKVIRPLLENAGPELIARGKLWLTTLYVNEEAAACTIQFPHATGAQLYNCGFDGGKKEWSPGVVLVAQVIQLAIEAGAGCFDLLRGEEPYKYKLGAVNRPLWMVNLKKL
jgi:CelD/BcsL family acetyltransferase involved in cellulose biosynthesis